MLPVCLSTLFHNLSLYFTKNGMNKVPKNNMVLPTTKVTNIFLKGERKLLKINVGKIVRETNVNLPGMVIPCSVPHLSHIIGLYAHPDL
ncbi:MAG: hypothetical protein K0Q87_5573 [Neobacillus sp.]|jgi:hypothetical protein|nr:hypothetical protein [Neobacillus sp.]